MNRDLPIAGTSRTTPRKPTSKEMSLTKADLAFKNAVLEEVEMAVKTMLPDLVRAVLNDDLSVFIDATVESVNELESRVNRLEGDTIVEGDES
jgi:hypothetical protein